MSNPWQRKEVIGDATLYLGDCLEIMPTLGKVDAVVTDPPYGIGADAGQMRRANRQNGAAILPSSDYGYSNWDLVSATQEQIAAIQKMGEYQIIFGGNYFDLPPSRCWLVWDKRTGTNDYADCELMWTNLDKPVRKIEWLWKGMLKKGNDTRVHPTQKPAGVMAWCIQQLPVDAQIILDPFMGSGTTGVACINLGRKFIGIEIEPKYFDIACKRIDQAERQGKLFENKPPKTEQLAL